MMNTTLHQVRTLIADLLGLDSQQIATHAHLQTELGADSLDVAEIIIALSSTFSIEVRDNEVEAIRSVDAIAAYIDAKLGIARPEGHAI